jgi:hypothetical protein
MSQKSSVPQAASFVSVVLKRDSGSARTENCTIVKITLTKVRARVRVKQAKQRQETELRNVPGAWTGRPGRDLDEQL